MSAAHDIADIFVTDDGMLVRGHVATFLDRMRAAGLVVRRHAPGVVSARHPLASWSFRVAVFSEIAGFVAVIDQDDEPLTIVVDDGTMLMR